jgi:proteasome-associated ATPase
MIVKEPPKTIVDILGLREEREQYRYGPDTEGPYYMDYNVKVEGNREQESDLIYELQGHIRNLEEQLKQRKTMSNYTRELEQQVETYRHQLEKAKEAIQQQQEYIDSLQKGPPISFGLLLRTEGEFGLIASENGQHRFILPPKDPEGNTLKYEPGSRLMMTPDGMIVGVLDPKSALSVSPGSIVTVNEVHEENATCEVDAPGGNRAILYNGTKPHKGDRVVLDEHGLMVLKNLGKGQKMYTPSADINVPWDAIGGCDDAKRVLTEAIEDPIAHSKLYAGYDQRVTKGVLVYGPPGCGKTLLGKAVATSLANIYESNVSSGFIYVKGPEILNKWVGESEAIIRSLFNRAREHKEKHGYPAVIFIDECDAVLMRRGGGRVSGMETTIVPMFLSEMDGMEESSAFVFLATNRPDMLDRAVVRDGRIDRKVRVDRPNKSIAERILKIHLGGKPLAKPLTVDSFASAASNLLYDDALVVFDGVTQTSGNIPIRARNLMSGAMLEGIVQRSVSEAIRRDKAASRKRPSGICEDDLKAAIYGAIKEMQNTDHTNEITEIGEELGTPLKGFIPRKEWQ